MPTRKRLGGFLLVLAVGTAQALVAYVKAETERWVALFQRLDLPKQGQ